MDKMLEIKNLHVEVDGKKILNGLNLKLEKGKVHAIMGPNGSGKSTLAGVIMGNPKYVVTEGDVIFGGKSILDVPVDERARKGIFLSFQYPQEISGVSISSFLRSALNGLQGDKKKISVLAFKDLITEKAKLLKIKPEFLSRSLNEGFSGGEKKKAEILQMLVLNPKLAILDETDSGLDIDALKAVSEGINLFKSKDKGVLVITHYNRILNHVKPDKISILVDGKVALEGDGILARKLEQKGYGWITKDSKTSKLVL